MYGCACVFVVYVCVCVCVCVCVQAYDEHLNMVLGKVEETITEIEIDDETLEEIIKVNPRNILSVFALSLCVCVCM